jgi:microcystin-dependent protein
MASDYTQNLKLELIATGEQAGQWGNATNTNLGASGGDAGLEQAIVGYGNPDFTSDADLTLTVSNSSGSQIFRNIVLNVTSVSLSATRNLIVPTIQKPYVVQNNTTGGQSIVVKTSGGTGVTIPNGKSATVYVDGTNVVSQITHIPDLTLATALPVASGGTGAATLAANNVLLGNGTSAVQEVAPGSSGNILTSDGTTWVSSGAAPAVLTGSLLMWATGVAPSGYLLCDGTAVSRSTYAALYAVVGDTFGAGDGSTTFNLPDYRDRMPVGAGTTYSAADTGGSADAIVVSHTHTATSSVTDPGHAHSLPYNRAGGSSNGTVNSDNGGSQNTGTATTGITVSTSLSTEGSSGTNANLPPYLGIYFIIKT